jgi:hypothetical protein
MNLLTSLLVLAGTFGAPTQTSHAVVFAGPLSSRLAPVEVEQRGETLAVRAAGYAAIEVEARVAPLPGATCEEDGQGFARLALPGTSDGEPSLLVVTLHAATGLAVTRVALPAAAASRVVRIGEAGCVWAVLVANGALVEVDAETAELSRTEGLVNSVAHVQEIEGGLLLRQAGESLIAGDAHGALVSRDAAGQVRRMTMPARASARSVVDDDDRLWLLDAHGVLWTVAVDGPGDELTRRASGFGPSSFGLVGWRRTHGDALAWLTVRGDVVVYEDSAATRVARVGVRPRGAPLVFDVDDDGALDLFALFADGTALLMPASGSPQRLRLGVAPSHAVVFQRHGDDPVTLALARGTREGTSYRQAELPAAGLWVDGAVVAAGLQVMADGALASPRVVVLGAAPRAPRAPRPPGTGTEVPATAEEGGDTALVCACTAINGRPALQFFSFAIVVIAAVGRRKRTL